MADVTITVTVGSATSSWTIPDTAGKWSRILEYLRGRAARFYRGGTEQQPEPPATLQGAADVLRDAARGLLLIDEQQSVRDAAIEAARRAVDPLE